jgi:hypothetical protein
VPGGKYRLLVDDEFPHIGRPALEFGRLGTLAGARGEFVIGPNMNHAVEWADFRVPEGASGETFARTGSAFAKRSSKVATVPGCNV